MDIFVGGGGDDLGWLGLGVVRHYALHYSAHTARPVLYSPNARAGRLLRAIRAAGRRGETINLVGHSWGAVDAYQATALALRQGLAVANLITLDPVSGLYRRPAPWPGGAFWLNITLKPSRLDQSDRMTRLWPLACKPSRLPVSAADEAVILDLHHWDVGAMLHLSGGLGRLQQSS
jgi:pimeloyl-ACP methyl ester carboxylesterase